MYYVLETLFLVGAAIVLLAGPWLLLNLFRSRKRIALPITLGLVGLVVLVSPVAYTRLISTVDLGERERIVDGDLHLTLTGWDRGYYHFLTSKKGIVVLQIANPDVTDEVLSYLEGQDQLTTLDLNDTQVTDQGLVHLSQLKSLKTVRLRGTKITDNGMGQLMESLPELNHLDLRQTTLSKELLETWKNERTGRRLMK